jgi:hypothetical protein
MKTVPIKDDFSPHFYEAIGKLAVAFGRVEYEIKLALKTLSGKGFSQGMAEAESTGQFWNLCKKTKALADKKLPSPRHEKFIRLIDEALKLAPQRNNNLHALWTTESGKPFRYCAHWNKTNKALEWRSAPVTITELKAHATTLLKLYASIHAARKAWPTI